MPVAYAFAGCLFLAACAIPQTGETCFDAMDNGRIRPMEPLSNGMCPTRADMAARGDYEDMARTMLLNSPRWPALMPPPRLLPIPMVGR